MLLVGDFPPPYGGVAVHVESVHRALVKASAECAVLDIGKGQLPADGVTAAGGYARFAGRLAWFAARGYRFHVHTSGANPKSWALVAACALGARPVVTFHSGLLPAWLRESPARQRTARAILSSYAQVIAVNDEIAAALAGCGVGAPVEVLPAFSASSVVAGAPPPGLSALRAEAAPLVAAMLAPEPLYGAAPLLSAFAQLWAQAPGARLALYGPGTLGEELRAQIAALAGPAASAIRCFGELHRPSALALVAACDLFVRPTLADGDAISVREALALGRRVVATRVGTRPPEALLVAPGDAAALATGMAQALAASPALVADAPDCLRRLFEIYGCAARGAATEAED